MTSPREHLYNSPMDMSSVYQARSLLSACITTHTAVADKARQADPTHFPVFVTVGKHSSSASRHVQGSLQKLAQDVCRSTVDGRIIASPVPRLTRWNSNTYQALCDLMRRGMLIDC